MSAKGSTTTAQPIEWKVALSIISKLEKEKPMLAILIATGCFTTLRISDILPLTWSDLSGDSLTVIERKTGKHRVIKLHPTLKELVARHKGNKISFIFTSGNGKPHTRQHVNRLLHEVQDQFKIQGNFTSHSLRKSGSKRIYESNGSSDRSLIILSEMLNHSGPAVTRRYIGIRQKELEDVYLSM